jgi:hypothetical protein
MTATFRGLVLVGSGDKSLKFLTVMVCVQAASRHRDETVINKRAL